VVVTRNEEEGRRDHAQALAKRLLESGLEKEIAVSVPLKKRAGGGNATFIYKVVQRTPRFLIVRGERRRRAGHTLAESEFSDDVRPVFFYMPADLRQANAMVNVSHRSDLSDVNQFLAPFAIGFFRAHERYHSLEIREVQGNFVPRHLDSNSRRTVRAHSGWRHRLFCHAVQYADARNKRLVLDLAGIHREMELDRNRKTATVISGSKDVLRQFKSAVEREKRGIEYGEVHANEKQYERYRVKRGFSAGTLLYIMNTIFKREIPRITVIRPQEEGSD